MGTRTVANLTAVISANNTNFKKGINGAQSVLNNFQKSIVAIGPAVIGAFSVGAIKNFTEKALTAYDVQAKAEAQLLTALKGRKDAQQTLIAQAKQLQTITLFGDEETIKAQALIAAFVDEEEQIKKIIPLVQDLATAKNMDLAAAADLVSKTLGSSTNALSRYGIQVEGAVGSVKRLESLMMGLNDAFGGQAEAAAKVGTGPLTQFKNIIGDITEQLGGAIIELSHLNDRLGDINNTLSKLDITNATDRLGKFLDKTKETRKFIARQYIPVFGKVLKVTDVARTGFELLNREVQNTPTILEEVVITANKTTTALSDMAKSTSIVVDTYNEFADNFEYSGERIFPKVSETVGWMTEAFEDFDEVIEEPELDALLIRFEQGIDKANEFKNVLTQAALQIGEAFATNIGAAIGAGEDLKNTLSELSAMIISALGDILIYLGLSTAPEGIPLAIAGLVLKGFGSFMGARISANQELASANMSSVTPTSQQGKSMLYGNDIRLSNNYSTNLYDRIG